MTDLTEQLDRNDRIAEAATPGPWDWRDDQYPGQLVHRVYLGDANSSDWMERGEVHPENILKCGDWLPSDGDATFIAHARSELPALNRAVRAVLVKLDELHRVNPNVVGAVTSTAYGVAAVDIYKAIADAMGEE